MIGTPAPRFTKEQLSRHYAPSLVEKIWTAARQLGHGSVFVNENTDPILDDHLYVNQMAGIPMVDIVQNSPETSFFTHWHTVTDDLASVNREALRMVATVTMTVVYSDFPAKQ